MRKWEKPEIMAMNVDKTESLTAKKLAAMPFVGAKGFVLLDDWVEPANESEA